MKLFEKIKDDTFSLFHVANEAEINRIQRGQMHIAAALIVLISVAELGMYFILRASGLLATDFVRYLVRYFFIPTGVNICALLANLAVRRWVRRLRVQAYANCMMFVCITFVVYTVHMHFSSLAVCFVIPILLTIVYGDIVLTSVVTAVSVTAKLISDLCIVWDPGYYCRLGTHAFDGIDVGISVVAMAAVYAIALQAILAERTKHRNALNQQLERMSLYEESITDPVTGIFNRKGLRRCFNRMLADDSGVSYTFVMMDLDCFKEINDTHGHLVGDQFLKSFSQLIDAVPNGEAFRFGGDEFCLLLRGYGRGATMDCCRDIRSRFQEYRPKDCDVPVTVSFGVALYEKGMAPTELVRRADEALYRAKRIKNHITMYREQASDGA